MAKTVLDESHAVVAQDNRNVDHDNDEASTEKLSVLEKRWGADVWGEGWTGVPSILLKGQRRLGLTNNQVMVLLHLLDHWHGKKANIYPKLEILANRMELSLSRTRTLVKELENQEFLLRKKRYRPGGGGQTTNRYNLDGLIKKLKKIAPDFKEHKNAKYDLERPKNPKSSKKPKENDVLIE